MESTREERMQQRLRGSQRRQVKEVDFGLTFPVVPAAGGQESPANPQLEGAPTPQITFDANKGSGEELNPRPAIRSGAFDANTSAKRRKLNNDGPSSGQNVNPAPLAPIPDIYAIPGDDGEDAPVQAENDEASNEKILLSPRIASPELGLHESTTDPIEKSSSHSKIAQAALDEGNISESRQATKQTTAQIRWPASTGHQAGLSTLEEGRRNAEDNELRREYKTKWSALKSFGSELQSRLLSHTINLDNGYTLDKRVREELKKKVALREEILRVRLEREQLALQMDEIRIKHENETKLVQERDALNTAAHDIELAVDRGRTNRPVHSSNDVKMSGPEVILKRIVNKISNKGDSGGILKQIKDFNGFLERAALALESKAG
ncbi:hypothetical protein M7I_2355 [Glarea lozoyensis 74030]|uniref:Inner kinetochore subunit AME1 domain-containing protein n=1 Tax=Glarea lozoyensis (strain ATCC 74030 / MF5533) TaxID=1104152 RepID=H0EIJ6_GLAL7|nr:hypothetical protein M7I_2355 [Glarea lozoyensis 74030]